MRACKYKSISIIKYSSRFESDLEAVMHSRSRLPQGLGLQSRMAVEPRWNRSYVCCRSARTRHRLSFQLRAFYRSETRYSSLAKREIISKDLNILWISGQRVKKGFQASAIITKQISFNSTETQIRTKRWSDFAAIRAMKFCDFAA